MAKFTSDALHIDFETFSEIDLTKAGAHKYAMDESTEPLCAAWAFGKDAPKLWLPGQPLPAEVEDHILMGGKIIAWNAQFERLIMKHVMATRYGWPVASDDQFICAMVCAMAMALPGKLEKAAPALGLDIKKDEHGHRIMLQLTKVRKPTKKNPATRFTPENAPEKFAALYDYCLQDVRVEQAILDRIIPLKESEQAFYWRDQAIQDRGCTIDIMLVGKSVALVEDELARLNDDIREITGGEVASVNATKQLTEYLTRDGIEWPVDKKPGVDRESIERLLMRDDLTNSQRVALEIRQDAAKTSTAKLERALTQLCDDGTVKGQLQFHGAMTGRDSARGLQLQNLPRPSKATNVKEATAHIKEGLDNDLIRTIHGKPMQVIADCLRGIVIAKPGHNLWVRDLSQIEARMTDWLSDNDTALQAFRNFDAKTGPDTYIVTAAGIYNVSPDAIDDFMRQVGKVSKLALGFGGGAAAFGSMAKIYRVDLVPLYPIVWELLDDDQAERALEAWKMRGKKSGMKKAAWLAAEAVKIKWREDNAAVVEAWYALEKAAIDAMTRPGEKVYALNNRVYYRKTGSWLRCVLPSGRSLFYPFPRLTKETTPWGSTAKRIRFWSVDGMTKQWKEFSLFGGLQFQNIVQAASRDVMFEAVVRCEDAGYLNVLRIHDEGIFQAPIGFGDEDEFHKLFVRVPLWAPGLPIAADGWVGPVYKK